jgi:hypothetical protein
MTATQVKHPWRATVRTVFQGAVSACAAAPLIYEPAATQRSGSPSRPASRIEGWLARFVPPARRPAAPAVG